MFANGSSPSESLMGHSVQVGVSIGGQKVAPRIANSMPPVRRWSFSEVTYQSIYYWYIHKNLYIGRVVKISKLRRLLTYTIDIFIYHVKQMYLYLFCLVSDRFIVIVAKITPLYICVCLMT